jgi:hypothetical protein
MTTLTFTVNYMRDGLIRRKFTVPATRRAISGIYFDGAPYAPCGAAVVAAMPKTLEKATCRAGFWVGEFSDVMRLDLRGYSRGLTEGACLGTLFAKADWKATPCYLDGFTFGMLKASAVKWSQGVHSIASDCGNVSIRVNSRLAESRLAEAAQSNATPVFFYD